MRRALPLILLVLTGCPSAYIPPHPVPTPQPTPGPTPWPTPPPGPSPTPTPAPWPVNAEAPRPVRFRYIPGPGACVGGAGYSDCKGGEPNCICHRELSKAIHGRPFVVPPYQGSDDPMDQFRNGGSENWYPSCRAVKLYADGDTRWFEAYFDLRYFGKEPFSAYFGDTIGNVLVVRKWAETHNRPVLSAKASAWLRAVWATLALMAVEDSTRTYSAWHWTEYPGSKEFDSEPTSWVGGYGMAAPSNRAYVNKYKTGNGLLSLFLSMALDHPTRRYNWSLDGHAANALCGAAKELYYPYSNATGKVDIQAVTPAASDFGLTVQERYDLKVFVASDGTRGLDTALDMMVGYRLGCDLTILRTERGVTAWFDTSSRAKGGSFVAVSASGGAETSLSRATVENRPEPVTVWLDGDQVCEESTLLKAKCIDVVAGRDVYRLEWPEGGQAHESP